MLALTNMPMAFSAPMAAPVVAQRASVSMVVKSQSLPFLEKPVNLDGSMAGDVGFDPLGLSNYFPLAWMREAEIKHGRVCMLAIVGYIAVDFGLRAPGAAKLGSLTSFSAHDATVASGHMWALLGVAGIAEIAGMAAIAATMNGSGRAPGDFAFDGGFAKDAAKLERFKLSEVKHSRLAMMAFSGLITQDALANGGGFPYF